MSPFSVSSIRMFRRSAISIGMLGAKLQQREVKFESYAGTLLPCCF